MKFIFPLVIRVPFYILFSSSSFFPRFSMYWILSIQFFFGTEKRTVAWTCSRHEHNDSYPIFQTFEHDRNELFLFADSKHFPELLAWEIHLNFAIVNNNIELYQIPA